LHVRRDRQSNVHPTVISHGYTAGFHAEFDWIGAFDPTPWLCVRAAIDHLGSLLPGGWPALMAANRALVLEARAHLTEALGIAPPRPGAMIGRMAAPPPPAGARGAAASQLEGDALATWFRARGVETWISRPPLRLLRLSAQLYNEMAEFDLLAELTLQA